MKKKSNESGPTGAKGIEKEGQDIFNQAVFSNNIDSLTENQSAYIKHIKLCSALRMVKYNSLVQEGFDKTQALEIVIKTNVFG